MPTKQPPHELPTYRLLTGLDDATFCHRVSEAVALGYKLYGSPSAAFNGISIIVAQAIIWPSIEDSAAQMQSVGKARDDAPPNL